MDSPFFVLNAGVVLAQAYLPRLWEELDLSVEGNFCDSAARCRAAYLLDYLVFGNTQPPEPICTLNRLLCGLPLTDQLDCSRSITTHERLLIDSMLQAIIARWSILGNTSVAGLRETFLQREGQLDLFGDRWNLKVSPKVFDIFIDQIPWGFSKFQQPWMERRLEVKWR